MKMNTTIELSIVISTIIVAFMLIMFFLLPPDPSTIDSDNDGVMNDKDAFPQNKYESTDTDGDGVGDNADKFIDDPAASQDSDDDGYPDRWNKGYTQNDSTSTPPLIIDAFPYDPSEYIDTDNDGVGDNSDDFPNDPSEWYDYDFDGIGNNKDINPNVDLGFTLSLEAFEVTRNVDILPRAQVYFTIQINDETPLTLDNDGSYWKVWLLQEQTIDFNLNYDIKDDGNTDTTRIEIMMYDKDLLFEDDIIDIHPEYQTSTLTLVIDHKTNTIDRNTKSNGQKATVWFTVTLSEYIEPDETYQELFYNWMYKGTAYDLSLNISHDKYQWYLDRDTNRSPQLIGTDEMVKYVTEHDEVIQKLTSTLLSMADRKNLNNSDTVDFILSFVQQNIEYQDDLFSKDVEEYWKYPIETLMEKNGDCEDSSILFQSIIKNTDYEVVMLFYVLDNETGHLATGVSMNDEISGHRIHHENIEYYYCETTSNGYCIGDKPTDIPDEPEIVIDLP